MGKLSDQIHDLIARQIKTRGIVVWYDPKRHYARLVDRLDLPGTTIVTFKDTFFRLRYELEPHIEFVTAAGRPIESCGVPPQLLVYIPLDRKESAYAMIEAETAGTVIEEDAPSAERNSSLRIQAEALFQEIAPERAAHVARQVEEGLLTLEDLDRIADEVGSIGSGTLPLIFGPASPVEAIIEFATSGARDDQIMEKKALGELRDLVKSEVGLDFGPVNDPAQARERMRRMLLLGEFVSFLPKDSKLAHFDNIALPDTQVQLDTLRHLCATWRNRIDFRQGYVEAARALDAAFGIGRLDIKSEYLEAIETFPSVETRLLFAAEKALLEDHAEGIRRLSDVKQTSFWSREDPALSLRWHLLSLVAELVTSERTVREALKALDLSASDMIRAYTLFTNPWMFVDRLYRHWESHLLTVDAGEHGGEGEFEQLAAKVRGEYVSVIDQMSRAFSERLKAAAFELPEWSHQSRVFVDRVEPLVKEGWKTAYLLIDALRYEMAAELIEGLSEDFDVELSPALASLPSITSVGMAALVPGAEKGIELVASGEKLAAVVEGQSLKDRQTRLAVISRRLPAGFLSLKLSEVLKLGAKRKKEIGDSHFIVMTSQEIDRLGEEGDDHAATRHWMDEVLDQVRRAVCILARLGVERFIIAADHGHLFIEEIDPGMLMDSPGGTTVELHRRVWIGNGGKAVDGYLRVAASEVKMGGDLELAFPRGLGCFKVKGGVGGYLHGGLSLQEMVIPVVELRNKPRATSTGARVTLIFDKPIITNRFFSITACFEKEGIFTENELCVHPVLVSGRTEVGFCAIAAYGYAEGAREVTLKPNQPNALTFMLTAETTPEVVTVRLIDCRTQLELASTTNIPVKLSI